MINKTLSDIIKLLIQLLVISLIIIAFKSFILYIILDFFFNVEYVNVFKLLTAINALVLIYKRNKE